MPEPALSFDEVLIALQASRIGDRYMAKCPSHEDERPSLSITQSPTGNILLKCFKGCTYDQICRAKGWRGNQLFAPKDEPAHPATQRRMVTKYDYRDAQGTVRFQVVRFEPKDFRQRQPDGQGGWLPHMKGVSLIVYRLNELAGHSVIYIVEGEKDADALWKLGLPATTNAGGGSKRKWKDEYSEDLKAIGVLKCVLLPDNDETGREHMTQVARSLKAHGIAIVQILLPDLPSKGDVSDWLKRGHTRADLEAIVDKALWIVPLGVTVPEDAPIDPERDPTRWPRSDLGAAESFVWREGHNVRFDHGKERWLAWDRHIWRPDAHSMINRLVHSHVRSWQQEVVEHVPSKNDRKEWTDWLFRLEQRRGIENIIAISSTILPVADTGDSWDLNPWLLAVGNGVLNLQNGELRNGAREDCLTLHTPTIYDPDATCPKWHAFLQDIFENNAEMVTYIKRALGYSLTGDMSEQCFFMLVGSGSNGKSTFLSTLEAVWGRYSYTTDMKTFTVNFGGSDQGFDLAELANRRLILASETKASSTLNEQALKNFTGGEKINAQRKYGHPFEYTPTGKIWLGLNHQPRAKDDSYGFWRRVRLVPFQRIFAGSSANPRLRGELLTEAPGILRWAVEGCLEWQREGLNPPDAVLSATDAYQQTEDPIVDFLTERTAPDTSAVVPCAKLYKGYCAWASDQGLTEKERCSVNSFGRHMTRRYDRKSNGVTKCYMGLRLLAKIPDELDFGS